MAIKLSKRHLLIYAVLLCIFILSITEPKETPEPETASAMHVSWAGKYYDKLTYEQLFKERDLVAVVKILRYVETHWIEGRLPYSIYEAEVINGLKGPDIEKVLLYQIGIYNPKENQECLVEGLPRFSSGGTWLLFLSEVGYERNLKMDMPGVYSAGGLEALNIINGRFNTNNIAKEVFPKISEVIGLSLSEFIEQHSTL